MIDLRATGRSRPTLWAAAIRLAAALALGALLSACGGDAAPAPSPTAASPTAPPPTMAMGAPATGRPTPVRATRAAADGPLVAIDNFTFGPATLTVTVGTTVTWINHDDTPHTVTSTDHRFPSSGGLDTDDQYTYRFTTPGTYAYFCSIHPQMTGQIIVR
ncbi:MAG TPA: cupredoxin domain-containing protein [Chloroflexia bacterium]|nr:cupredoxin domain-containing protein [Chloroflexia bacterium]